MNFLRRVLCHSKGSGRNQSISATQIDTWVRAAYIDPSVPHYLSAMLTEYQAIRTEIQNRSDFQHRIVQLHLAAIAAVLTAALIQGVPAAVAVIPLTSAVLGLWWLDHALVINEAGGYLKECERRINLLLNLDAFRRSQPSPSTSGLRWPIAFMEWENRYRQGVIYDVTRQRKVFRGLITATFLLPAWVAVGWNVLIIAFAFIPRLQEAMSGVLHIPKFSGGLLLGVSITLALGTLLLIRTHLAARRHDESIRLAAESP